VPDEFIAAVFGVMAACPQHTFQVLTKRPERMRRWFEWIDAEWRRERKSPGYNERGSAADIACAASIEALPAGPKKPYGTFIGASFRARWPLPNVWLGVSVEDQRRADERIPELLRVPAAVRFLSCEPLLGAVDLRAVRRPAIARPGNPTHFDALLDRPVFGRLSWVIVGGESGPGARPFDLAWARSIVAQCKAAGVKVFVKQLGAVPVMDETEWRAQWDGLVPLLSARNLNRAPESTVALSLASTKGGDPAEWPADLRVREWPENSR
jgi:hypothetical protein